MLSIFFVFVSSVKCMDDKRVTFAYLDPNEGKITIIINENMKTLRKVWSKFVMGQLFVCRMFAVVQIMKSSEIFMMNLLVLVLVGRDHWSEYVESHSNWFDLLNRQDKVCPKQIFSFKMENSFKWFIDSGDKLKS